MVDTTIGNLVGAGISLALADRLLSRATLGRAKSRRIALKQASIRYTQRPKKRRLLRI